MAYIQIPFPPVPNTMTPSALRKRHAINNLKLTAMIAVVAANAAYVVYCVNGLKNELQDSE